MYAKNKHVPIMIVVLVCVALITMLRFEPCSSVEVRGDNEGVNELETEDKQQSNEPTDISSTANDGGEKTVTVSPENPETFDRLYAEGIKAYHDHLWYSCAFKIESALKDFKVYSASLTECRLKCNNGTRPTKLSNMTVSRSANTEEFAIFFGFLKIADCFRRCKEELVGKRNPVSAEMEHAFQERSPYLYLQYCYFKLDKYKLAASSTYTYYLSHSDDEETKHNIRHYRDELKVLESDFLDMEITPFKENYIKGVLAYLDHEWLVSIEHLERSVTEYLKEIPKCYVNCHGSSSSKFTGTDFITGVADAITRIMMCQIECETKVSVVYSDPIPHILQSIFYHLQYAYYTVQNYEKCSEAIASFLAMNASHTIMQENKISLKELFKYTDDDFIPRKDIQQYVDQRTDMTDTMDFINKNYKWPHDIQDDEAIEYEDMIAEMTDTEDDPNDWMTRYERLGMHLIAKSSDLNRKGRFVTDGIIKAEQCEEIKSLLAEIPYGSKNVKFFNFRTAQKILSENPEEEHEAYIRLLIRGVDVIRHYVQRFTQEENIFFAQHSSIICYRPSEEKLDCYPQEDGTCLDIYGMSDELFQGSFTSVTYLSDVDEDGDFYFLNEKNEKDSSFGAKCGRTVGFNTGDRHSLNIPVSKERCAFVIRYSTDRSDDDREYAKTITLLKNIEQLKRKKANFSPEKAMQSLKDKGVKVVKSGKELQGNERFLADGLASEQQCSSLTNLILKFGLDGDGYAGDKSPHTKQEHFSGLTLTELVKSAALAGDGYDHLDKKPSLISPHTKNEMFMGINMYRASELFHSKAISSVAFNDFLDLSEISRQMVELYFNLTTPLYFDYTHLVCRSAMDDSNTKRDDLSHPVHADNCILKPDGSCIKEFPAFSEREYSAILYMNDNFQGGEFFFAHSNKSEQISIRPKCGRLVGFSSGEFHGVRAVLSGQRCALALWFTTDPNYKELAHIYAKRILRDVENEAKSHLKAHEDL